MTTKLDFISIDDYRRIQSVIQRCYPTLSERETMDMNRIESKLMDTIYFINNMYPEGYEIEHIPEA